MFSSYMLNEIRNNVKFIINDLVLYNIWMGEVVGQISDGKWENSRRPMEYFWMPDAVYDPNAKEIGWGVVPKSCMKWHYTDKGAMPNPLANDLVSCEYNGEYFYVLRVCACIAAALGGVKLDSSNDSAIEYLWKRIIEGKNMDACLHEMKEADDNTSDKNGSYKGYKRLGMDSEEFEKLWNAMHNYWAVTLGRDNYFGPRSKGRKSATVQLKRLKELMHNVFDLA